MVFLLGIPYENQMIMWGIGSVQWSAQWGKHPSFNHVRVLYPVFKIIRLRANFPNKRMTLSICKFPSQTTYIWSENVEGNVLLPNILLASHPSRVYYYAYFNSQCSTNNGNVIGSCVLDYITCQPTTL